MDVYSFAEELFLFQGLDQRTKKQYLSDGRIYVREYLTAQTIYDTDRFTPCLGLVLSGSVKVEKRAEGKIVPMRLMKRGEVFGAASLFGGSEYVTLITAKGKTKIMFFPQDFVSELINREPSAAYHYIVFLSEKVRYLNSRIDFFTAGGAKERLFEYLSRVCGHDGGALPVSMKTLAGQLDMSRASLYRAFEALEAEGKIKKTGNGYLVNKK